MVLSLCKLTETGNANRIRGGDAGVHAKRYHGIGNLLVFLRELECICGNSLELHCLAESPLTDIRSP